MIPIARCYSRLATECMPFDFEQNFYMIECWHSCVTGASSPGCSANYCLTNLWLVIEGFRILGSDPRIGK